LNPRFVPTTGGQLHGEPLPSSNPGRPQKVTTESGEPLNFIQEDKKDGPDFFVILPKTRVQGEKFTIVTSHSGKDAILNGGNGRSVLL